MKTQKDETVEVSESSVAKDSATKDTDETVLSSGEVSEPTKEKTGEETQSSSSFNGKQLSSGDYSSIAGTWTNSRGEFVTISPEWYSTKWAWLYLSSLFWTFKLMEIFRNNCF